MWKIKSIKIKSNCMAKKSGQCEGASSIWLWGVWISFLFTFSMHCNKNIVELFGILLTFEQIWSSEHPFGDTWIDQPTSTLANPWAMRLMSRILHRTSSRPLSIIVSVNLSCSGQLTGWPVVYSKEDWWTSGAGQPGLGIMMHTGDWDCVQLLINRISFMFAVVASISLWIETRRNEAHQESEKTAP